MRINPLTLSSNRKISPNVDTLTNSIGTNSSKSTTASNMIINSFQQTNFMLRIETVPALYKADETRIIVGKGNDEIAFILDNKEMANSIDTLSKIKKIYGLISMLNRFIPENPMKEVSFERSEITHTGAGGYGGHQLIIDVENPFYLQTTAHEMGHDLFSKTISAPHDPKAEGYYMGLYPSSKDEIWNKMYYYSLGHENYKVITDSEYTGEKSGGHPFDSPGEMFASSVMVFMMYPDKLISKIGDPNTLVSTKISGKLIYCYLRDRIFNGIFYNNKFYAKGTPEYEPIERPRSLRCDDKNNDISVDDIIDSLVSSANDKNNGVRRAGITAMGLFSPERSEFVKSMINGLTDNDWLVRDAASGSIGLTKNKIFLPYLVEQYKSDIKETRENVIKAVYLLGFKDETVIQILLRALKDDDRDVEPFERYLQYYRRFEGEDRESIKASKRLSARNLDVRDIAARAIGILDIKDKRFIGPFINNLTSTKCRWRLKMDIIKTLGILNIRDKRIIRPLIDSLSDKDEEIQEATKKAIDELEIDTEKMKFKD